MATETWEKSITSPWRSPLEVTNSWVLMMYPISFQLCFWSTSSEVSLENAAVFSSVAESVVWRLVRFPTLGKAGTAWTRQESSGMKQSPRQRRVRNLKDHFTDSRLFSRALLELSWIFRIFHTLEFIFFVSPLTSTNKTSEHKTFLCMQHYTQILLSPSTTSPSVLSCRCLSSRFNRIIVFIIHRVRYLAARNCGLNEFASGLKYLVDIDRPILQLFTSFRKSLYQYIAPSHRARRKKTIRLRFSNSVGWLIFLIVSPDQCLN